MRLVHRLLHASEVVPWGRPHLFYMLRALRMATRLSKPLVIIDRAAESELAWCDKATRYATHAHDVLAWV